MARFLHSSAASRSTTTLTSLCCVITYYLCVPFVLLPTIIMAWSPSPSSSSFNNNRAAASIKGGSVTVDGTNFGGVTPLFSTVDELYYNPTTTSSSSSSSIFDTSSSSSSSTSAATATASTMATSEEMEMAAQNYGNGGDVMNINPQQKITLTRWLSAKVQDYPEVSSLVGCCCWYTLPIEILNMHLFLLFFIFCLGVWSFTVYILC